ncbi:MAG: DNA ligase D [Bacteroidota bacterium]|nr:DNA ligase D [Bacteroidota bacterium]
MTLSAYNKKRVFNNTTEPKGKSKNSPGKLIFVIQQHAASHLHYDFRLEMDGVLKSWAVPKGPSLNPGDKRLAMMVEDHPYDYKDFEGTIPEGNYGAGNVIVWDNGTYHAAGAEEGETGEKQLLQGLKKGDLKFVLQGRKLKGEFALVKMHGRQENAWLLLKKKDKHAGYDDVLKKNKSVISRQTLEGLTKKSPSKTASKTLKLSLEKSGDAPKTKAGTKSKTKAEKISLSKSKTAGTIKKKSAEKIKPMLAEVGEQPFDDEGWIFEVKLDGYRALASVADQQAELYSRNQKSFNEAYPSIIKELENIEQVVLLDGEVVVENSKGRSEFQLLQNTGNTNVNLKYYVFDILHLNGHDLYDVPLIERKNLLKLLLEKYAFKKIIYSEHIAGKGISFYKAALKKNLEGIMAKNANSPYRISRRSGEWLKIKINQQQEMIICGFTAPQGSREFFGALLLGYYKDGKLIYAGNCGTGFAVKTLGMLYGKAKVFFTNTSPFKERIPLSGKVQWIKPRIVCQVKFTEWTKDGHLRHPVYLGLRADKKAEDVTREKTSNNNMAKKSTSGKTASPIILKKKAAVKKEKAKIEKPAKDNGESKSIATSKLSTEKEYDLKVGKTVLHLTNQNKIYWPKEKYTKGDLITHYNAVSEYILPYLKDRPQSMNRFPNGIGKSSFYQKDVDTEKVPSWLITKQVYSTSNEKMIDYLICNDKATLLYMANLGCIEINPWNSRITKEDYPDWVVIDLDPEDIAFTEVVKTALAVRETLEKMDLSSCVKTSGATGLHIFIPLGAKYDYKTAKTFAELIAHMVNEQLPETTSIVRSPSKRKKKVYLDFLQNNKGQTLAAPYSARPRPGGTVSTPLDWKEVNSKLNPADYTIKNIIKRIEKVGDLWKPVLGKGQDIMKALKKLND